MTHTHIRLINFNMASLDNSNNCASEDSINNPPTSHQNAGNETYDDGHSVASSAGSLQLSMLESKLDSEMIKMGRMMQDTVSSLSEIMNQKLTELDTKFNNLVADIVPNTQNQNVNSSVAQTNQSNSESGTPAIACSSHSKSGNSQFRMKPQQFCGTTDFDEFLSQFEITCEINAWQYRQKSLYLANCLTGDARSILSELDHDVRRDYNTLVEKLANRFGSVNRSEIFRTQLKSRIRSKAESIPELAHAIKKLVRQAYPGVNKDVIETLAIDNFIDALTDSDIRLRVRELGPKTLTDAERTALRLESHKIADKQRSRIVGQIDTNGKQKHNEKQVEASSSFKALQNSINSLSDHVQDLKRQNRERERIRFDNTYSQNNPNFGKTSRANRPSQNDPPPLHNMQRKTVRQDRGNNFWRNAYPNRSPHTLRNGANDFVPRSRQNSNRQAVDYNHRHGSTQFENNQGNGNQSGWRATNRRH